MEYETRFYYSIDSLKGIIDKLSSFKELTPSLRTYEKTIQYNHCSPEYNFYSKEIDGRFRIRISLNDESSNAKISWKRRLPSTLATDINKEEEKEVHFSYGDLDNLLYIIENVQHFKLVESYERYRTTFSNEDIEISVDEYPFGVALEIENKSETKNPEETVKKWIKNLGLNINDSYRLSWDDKYKELCEEQHIDRQNVVAFNKKMPSIK